MKLGYLGPQATFTQQAAGVLVADADMKPYSAIDELLQAVEIGELTAGVVPLENSTEGVVNATADGLIFKSHLYINREITLPIVHNLLVREENINKPLTKILSHTQALAQCRAFLQSNYRGVELLPVASTAEAAQLVSRSDEAWGAISTALAADVYQLALRHTGIQDESGNVTKFVLVSKENTAQIKKGHTCTIAFSTQNKPGALYKVLDILALWDINMTSIFSRPMKNEMGAYVFWVELEVGDDENDIREALMMVERKTSFFKTLGCYESV